ncbi:MAG: GerMN domain-containing protein [Spirochaetota bacterium]
MGPLDTIRSLFVGIDRDARKRNRAILFVVFVAGVALFFLWMLMRSVFTPYSVRTIYFYDERARRVKSERQEVLNASTDAGRIQAVIEAMRNGPVSPSLMRLIPYETDVRNIFYTDHSLIIDLSEGFFLKLEEGREVSAVESVLSTVFANFPSVHEIRIVVNGTPIGVLGGTVNCNRSFIREDLKKEPFRPARK